ncbi:LysR family transcriptional regulator [Anaerotruncus rubiinfantis]|uniref:LysR family transcriptional regulator n=1 Tax=Anaerotruncus rubiinfantis TaxID=1720200 RepID=UPI0008323758|nr:LysR family transcriptional regulator [Anaerotruncus rubiinfantis]
MFEELRTFVAVAETKSFTKAAKKLSFSQPTVSQQVKRMEIFFNGATLLNRSSYGANVELTPEGELVYERCVEILALVDATVREVLPHKGKTLEQLHVGASRTVGDHLLPAVLRAFSDACPAAVISVTIGNTRQVCDWLRGGEIDIGLIEGRNMYYDFERADFYTDQLILVAAPSLAAGITSFNPAKLGELPWITRESGSGTRQYQRDFLTSSQIKVSSQIECNSNTANAELARQGLGVTLISESAVRHELDSGTLVALPMEKPCSRKFSYILNGRDPTDPLLSQLIRILRSLESQTAG